MQIKQLYRMQAVTETVCSYMNVRWDKITRDDRTNHIKNTRHICAYFLRNIRNDDGTRVWSSNEIAQHLGYESHGSVIHAERVIKKTLEKECELSTQVKEIDKLLDEATYSEGIKKSYNKTDNDIK